MTQLVRVLWDKAWFEPINPELPIELSNTRGDAAANFCSEDCRLSFFRVPSEAGALERIATAVATLRAGLDDVDYCVVDKLDVEELGCTLDDSVAGSTLFDDVNRLHVDVCDLNLPRLNALIFLAVSTAQTGRIRGRQVRSRLVEAIKTGTIDPSRLKPGLRKSVA